MNILDKVEELIEEADIHSFEKNNYRTNHGVYSRPTPQMLAWIAECEDVILTNFGRDSSPWRAFEQLDKVQLDGNYEDTFEKQKSFILGALMTCRRIQPLETPIKKLNQPSPKNNKVFIVHGHDDALKNEVARFIERLKLEPIILHEQPNSGDTIIEKIDRNTDVGFGVVLYTPCDVGNNIKHKDNLQPRARQNVVFEHGYLIAKIGRKNVAALVKGNVEKPNDISGVVYIPTTGDWKLNLAKELKYSGYNVDMNLVI